MGIVEQSCSGPVACGGCDDCLALRSRRAARDEEAEAELGYELSANFEPGTEVVNVLTGERRRVR